MWEKENSGEMSMRSLEVRGQSLKVGRERDNSLAAVDVMVAVVEGALDGERGRVTSLAPRRVVRASVSTLHQSVSGSSLEESMVDSRGCRWPQEDASMH